MSPSSSAWTWSRSHHHSTAETSRAWLHSRSSSSSGAWRERVETADVVICGGGISGCALAYQLAKRKVDVVLLERAELGSQSTGKCAGGVRQQFSNEPNVRLQRMAVGMLETFEEEVGHPADFRQIGYLFVLTQPQQVEAFRRN